MYRVASYCPCGEVYLAFLLFVSIAIIRQPVNEAGYYNPPAFVLWTYCCYLNHPLVQPLRFPGSPTEIYSQIFSCVCIVWCVMSWFVSPRRHGPPDPCEIFLLQWSHLGCYEVKYVGTHFHLSEVAQLQEVFHKQCTQEHDKIQDVLLYVVSLSWKASPYDCLWCSPMTNQSRSLVLVNFFVRLTVEQSSLQTWYTLYIYIYVMDNAIE